MKVTAIFLTRFNIWIHELFYSIGLTLFITGVLTANSVLDYETHSRYHFKVVVADRMDHTCTSDVFIKLIDVNDNIPNFEQELIFATVRENASQSVVLTQVRRGVGGWCGDYGEEGIRLLLYEDMGQCSKLIWNFQTLIHGPLRKLSSLPPVRKMMVVVEGGRWIGWTTINHTTNWSSSKILPFLNIVAILKN